MKLLFYLEPLREWHRPAWKIDWLRTFEKRIYETLRASVAGDRVSFALCLDESYRHVADLPADIRTFYVPQEAARAPFEQGYLDATIRWYNGTWTERAMTHYREMLGRMLGDFVPDVVITHTPAPHLSAMFPDALLLHNEVSIFSRPPYPLSFYLDPVGMIGRSFITRYGKELAARSLTPDQARGVAEVRSAVRRAFLDRSPFRALLSGFRERFPRLVLLPLQVSGFYAFDALAPYESQAEYLEAMLARIPRHIGVVVTTHPADNPLDRFTLAYLRARYPHFLYEPVFDEYFCASQYLVGDVDGVVNYSSSLGVQTLFFENKLISLGRGFYECVADATSLDNLEDTLKAPARAKDGFLHWLLTRYTILDAQFTDPSWLSTYLAGALQQYRREGLSAGFYEEVAPIDRVAAVITAALADAQPTKSPVPNNVEALRNRMVESADLIENLQKVLAGNRVYIAALEDWKRNTENDVAGKNTYIAALEGWKRAAERRLSAQQEEIGRLVAGDSEPTTR